MLEVLVTGSYNNSCLVTGYSYGLHLKKLKKTVLQLLKMFHSWLFSLKRNDYRDLVFFAALVCLMYGAVVWRSGGVWVESSISQLDGN